MPRHNKMFDENRERYWNEEYTKYWDSRVAEANNKNLNSSIIIEKDGKASADETYMNAIKLLQIKDTDEVIEIGCGFGRSLSMLCKAAHRVTAVDISSAMIDAAKNRVKEDKISFYVSPSETMPFEDKTYNVAVCFASFDAMYQTEALVEINRVSKAGARILITGKNDNYFDNDQKAIEAEYGARKKGHPNYFTNVTRLVNEIGSFGFTIETSQYFLRRGEFGKNYVENRMPLKFYEYLFVLRKNNDCKKYNGGIIYKDRSKTYMRQENTPD